MTTNDDNILELPIKFYQYRKNIKGPLCVECQVTDRYLQFYPSSANLVGGEFIFVDVMTTQDDEEKPYKKSCQLVITREDLLAPLKHVHPKP